jgi:ADP-ribose pyrophosphatase
MRVTDKTEGVRLGWRVRETQFPITTPWMRLRQDRVAIAGRGEITYTYEERTDAVGVVPVTSDGMVLLIRQYRYPLDAWCLEIPAGGMRDHQGESPEAVARAELREEIGGSCAAMVYVGFFYVAAAAMNQRFHVFLAQGVECTAQAALEATERIEICPTPVREALHLARSGQMPESQSALSLLLCEHLLAQATFATIADQD